MQPHPIVMKADWIEARRALLADEIAGLPASRGTILRARGVDAQQIFVTATLMCVVWLTTLTMLVRQAQFTDFAANRASLVSGQSVAGPIPPLSAHNH
jgi:hypothetical protein